MSNRRGKGIKGGEGKEKKLTKGGEGLQQQLR